MRKELGWIRVRLDGWKKKERGVEKMRKAIILIVSGLLLSLGQVEADIGTNFSDDFESYNVGDVDPGGWVGSAGGENWVTNVLVSSNKSYYAADTNTTGSFFTYHDFTSYTFVPQEYVQVDCYAQVPQTNEAYGPLDVRSGWTRMVGVTFNGDGKFAYYDSSYPTLNTTDVSYVADSNYHIRANIYPTNYFGSGSAARWEFYVNDMATPVASDLSWITEVSTMSKYLIVTGHGGVDETAAGYVDDILVQSIPEPSALLLLGMGMCGLLAMRLRKKQERVYRS